MITGSARFARIRARAQAALEWERWAPALLPGALFLLIFVALALFGVWERIGDPWRLIALVAALGGGAWLAWRGLKRSRPVSPESTLRRIEEDSALSGRPFEALTDAPAALRSDPDLWRAHVTRMAREAAKARAGRPHAALAAHDRLALRAGVLVVVLLGLGFAGTRAPGRIADAFLPGVLMANATPPLVDAWIQPPDYTGAAPVFLTASQEAADATVFHAPAGSELTVRISGVRRPPAARVADDDGRRRLRFEPLQNDVHETTATIASDSVLTIRTAGRWTISVTPDAPPQVAFTAPPAPEDNDLNLAYRASDDYGVTELALILELDGETDEVPLNLGGVTPRETETELTLDLTEHRWAGTRVDMTLKAVDAMGQEGLSETVDARIPQRIFLSPLAKAIAEQRRILLNAAEPYAELPELPPMTAEDAASQPEFADEQPERRIERAPQGVLQVADMLGATMMGAERYFTDYAVYTGLATARSDLLLGRDQAEIAGVPPLLWQIALRVETGDLADAEAALRAAERELLEALARGADADELAQLFDAFQQAMNRYLDALAREAIEQGRVVEAPQGGGQAPEGMDMQSVQDLLDAIREASELGDEAGARAALAALTELLRNMEMQIALGGGGQSGQQREQTPEQRAMQDALNELSDMIGDQRELMDETVREGGQQGEQQGQQGQEGGEQGDQQGQGMQQGQQGGQPGGEGGQSQAGQSGQPGGQQGQQAGQGQPGQQPGQGGPQGGQNGQDGQQGGQFGQGGNQQGVSPSELAGRQGALGDRLDQLGEQIGEGGRGGAAGGDPGEAGPNDGAGEFLDRAREAMREAEEALRRGDRNGALAAQEEALNSLRDGARQMAQQQDEDSEENRAAEGREQYDPMGRSAGGTAGAGDNVRVPDEAERQRAREILDELRRRAGERRRPAVELDYLRRLLERF